MTEFELTKRLNKVLEDIKLELENSLSLIRSQLLEKFNVQIEQSPEDKLRIQLLNDEYSHIKEMIYQTTENGIAFQEHNQENIIVAAEVLADDQTIFIDKKVKSKKYACDYPNCQYSTNIRGNYQKHLRVHTGEKPFKCDWEGCEYRCSDPKSIKDHVRCVHTKERNFPCQFPGCERLFGRQYEVKVHYLKHHQDPNDWPHKCPWPGCDRSFLYPKELHKHNLHHTGERPYKCDFPDCQATFNHTSVLSRHKKEFHAPKVQMTCGYDGCPSKFLRQRDLDQHIKRVHLGVLGPKKSSEIKRSLKRSSDHDYNINLTKGKLKLGKKAKAKGKRKNNGQNKVGRKGTRSRKHDDENKETQDTQDNRPGN